MDWFDLLAVQGILKSLLQPQFETINSLALSFLCGPTLTFMHDYWENHSSYLHHLHLSDEKSTQSWAQSLRQPECGPP